MAELLIAAEEEEVTSLTLNKYKLQLKPGW